MQGRLIRGLTFVDVASGEAEFSNVEFVECQFIGTDLCGIKFEKCRAGSSTFERIRLDRESQMDIDGLIPGDNIRGVHDEVIGDVYAPEAIAEVLEILGAPKTGDIPAPPTYSKHALNLIGLLEKVARAYSRSKILYENDHRHRSLVDAADWPELRQILLKHEIVSEEMRESRGANVQGYRLRVNVDDLMAEQTGGGRPQSATAGLWRELRAMQ